ncbi:copper chaperone PCu(A)C [Chachezhania antarctica]|uniref:copper chaperone PCu(A)C n=1 Tax=Chachezhania antarctica TaxID=2340860 RepID=UPI001F08E80E|nr:copper chaperone PCu(A)C [Chachezhania antarctica]|tara:strand:- start:9215 stop:9655 length:441 start_codon:yes stop_codon:yes gene_type:complete
MYKQICMTAAVIMAALGSPALADPMIRIVDPYTRVASPVAKAGAAFMIIENEGDSADRLIGVRTGAAARAELHTHKESADGVMQMLKVEDGIPVAAGGTHMLARGGDHVMLMGLTGPLEQGSSIPVTLIFETSGEIDVDIPVDNDR